MKAVVSGTPTERPPRAARSTARTQSPGSHQPAMCLVTISRCVQLVMTASEGLTLMRALSAAREVDWKWSDSLQDCLYTPTDKMRLEIRTLRPEQIFSTHEENKKHEQD